MATPSCEPTPTGCVLQAAQMMVGVVVHRLHHHNSTVVAAHRHRRITAAMSQAQDKHRLTIPRHHSIAAVAHRHHLNNSTVVGHHRPEHHTAPLNIQVNSEVDQVKRERIVLLRGYLAGQSKAHKYE